MGRSPPPLKSPQNTGFLSFCVGKSRHRILSCPRAASSAGAEIGRVWPPAPAAPGLGGPDTPRAFRDEKFCKKPCFPCLGLPLPPPNASRVCPAPRWSVLSSGQGPHGWPQARSPPHTHLPCTVDGKSAELVTPDTTLYMPLPAQGEPGEHQGQCLMGGTGSALTELTGQQRR